MNENAQAAFPQWTTKAFPPKSGRDHLGLGSVSSDQILSSLVPGINVLTFHPRYHSFYAFLLDEFRQQKLPRSRASWVRFFRPRDYIFCLGAQFCDRPEHGDMRNVVGSQQTRPVAEQDLDAFPTDHRYIKSDLGGYGLYYRSVMIELNIVYPGGPGFPYPIDLPSEEGLKLAAHFRDAVRGTRYYQEFFQTDGRSIPRDVIDEYIHSACLCQLQTASAPDRKPLQQRFLFGGHAEKAGPRRSTLRMMLDVADQTVDLPVDSDTFRQLIYFGAAGNTAAYEPQASMRTTQRRWRLYQAREYYAFALNTLWRHLCDWGLENHGDVHPQSMNCLWQHVANNMNFNSLADLLDLPHPHLDGEADVQSLMDWLQISTGASRDNFDEVCTLDSPVQEHRLWELAKKHPGNPEVCIAGMLTMLALIYLRFNDPQIRLEPEWEISRMGANGRLSVDSFIRRLQKKLGAGPFTLDDMARWLYADYIILQHQLIASSKLPDNTFRFRREGNKLRFFNLEANADFMDSRYEAMATTVFELGFCGDPRLPDHTLTQEGRHVLKTGELP